MVDDADATAWRGLADAADREAGDAALTERLFRHVLELEPHDCESHVRLIGVLLAEARPVASEAAFERAAASLGGALDERDFVERLLLPVARNAVAAGQLALASRVTGAARAVRAPEAEELARLVAGLVEALEYGEFVEPDRLGTTWWIRPSVLAAFDTNRRPLSRWLAARIDSVTDGVVAIQYADVLQPADAATRPDRAWTEIPLARLARLSLDELPSNLIGTILEIGIYGDGQNDGSTVVRVVESRPMRLPEADRPLNRYARQIA